MGEEVKYTLTLNDLLTSKLVTADGAATKLESTMSAVQAAASALGIVAGVAGVGAFINSMVTAGAKVEDARVGLTTLLRDSAEAGSVIENTMQDATKTPFAFEGLLAANKTLISAGENSVSAREAVLNLANAIAATGGGDDELQRMTANLQQIRNTGVATAMDIRQFGYAGINIYQLLADATGKPISALKDMEISYDMLTLALKKAHDQGGMYANGLENMANNTSVRISNLGDAMFQLKVKMFDDLKPAVDAVVTSGLEFVGVLKDGWNWLINHKTEVQALGVGLSVLAGGVIAYNGYLAAMAIATVANTTLTFLQIVATDGLALALYAAGITGAAAWALMTGGLSILAVGLYEAWQHCETFRGAVIGLWGVVKEFGTSIAQVFSGIWDIVFGSALEGDWSKGMNKITSAFSGFGERAKDAFTTGFESAKDKGTVGMGVEDAGSKKVVAKSAGSKSKENTAAAPDISPAKASGTKAVTMNISIGKLIETFKVNTTNLHESSSKIGEHITNTILAAVNDASIQADI